LFAFSLILTALNDAGIYCMAAQKNKHLVISPHVFITRMWH